MTKKLISIVSIVSNNNWRGLHSGLTSLSKSLEGVSFDYEIVLVDNSIGDIVVQKLRDLVNEDFANLQVFKLVHPVSSDLALIVGLENSLGDSILVLDITSDDKTIIEDLVKQNEIYEIVFVKSPNIVEGAIHYKLIRSFFLYFYRVLYGVDLHSESPRYRVMTRGVVNFLLRQKRPEFIYRSPYLLKTFTHEYLQSTETITGFPLVRNISDDYEAAIGHLIANSKKPLRLAVFLAFAGAFFNLIYAFYVFLSALLRENIAPGWASVSLQISVMFFLFSIIIIIFCEYLFQNAEHLYANTSGLIAEEFTSKAFNRNSNLNVTIS